MSINDFKCPIGLSNEDAICPECICMKPIKNYGDWYSLPYENSTHNPIIIEDASFCEEWKKKEDRYACGCSGNVKCKCGYFIRICHRPTDVDICPLCGRICETIYIPISYDFSITTSPIKFVSM